MFITLFILSVVFVEALTELFVKSLFFSSMRNNIKSRGKFLEELLSCGYCTSVWVAVIPALFLSLYQMFLPPICAFFLIWLTLHRLANFLHNINDNYFDKYYSKKK